MSNLSALAEMEDDEPELVPEILTVDARLSIKGPVSNLLALFARAAAVAPLKEVLPGTSSALLEASTGDAGEVAHVRLTATDGEQTISVVGDGIDVLIEGRVLIPPARVRDILKNAPSPDVRIEIIGAAATITSGRARWTVQTPAGDALGVRLDVSGVQTHPVSSQALQRALSVARRAAAQSDARRSLMQVLIRNGAVTGCDGGRLHRSMLPELESFDVSIRAKSVDEMLATMRASDETIVRLGYDVEHVVLEVGPNIIVSQRFLLPFPPDVERLLLGPAFSNDGNLAVDRRQMLDAVRRVRINSDPDSAAMRVAIVPLRKTASGVQKWAVAVRARDRSGNASTEVLEAFWDGTAKPRELTFNHNYLSDLLDVYEGEEISFKIGQDTKSARSPLLLEDEDLGIYAVVQQMHSAW